MKRLILQCKEPNTAISWTVRELVCESSRDSSRLREKSEQKGRGGSIEHTFRGLQSCIPLYISYTYFDKTKRSPLTRFYETRLSSGVVLNLDSIYIGLCSCSLFFKYKSRQIAIIYAYYITQFHKFSTSLLCFDVEKKNRSISPSCSFGVDLL